MTTTPADDHLAQAAAVTVAAMDHEMCTAARQLATQMRHQVPTARRVRLCGSDQGSWLDLMDWSPDTDGDLNWFEITSVSAGLLSLPSHFYEERIPTRRDHSPVPGLWCVDAFRGTYHLDLEAVAEYQVDASAAWTQQDWSEYLDQCITRASDAMRPRLREAFDTPPGGQYIED